MMELLQKELSDKILKAYYTVHHTLGYGFLEKVYENAMIIELRKAGLACATQKPIKVYYSGEEVGNYFADILVEDTIILELKATPLVEEHTYQLLNYLKATDIEIGILLSFGKEPKFIRKIFTNDRKNMIETQNTRNNTEYHGILFLKMIP